MSFKGGIALVDKPEGLTSHDVVDFVRRKFGFKKVGHAGTLDPMATGLLIILLEGFTKRSVHFSNYDKEYEAELCLGARSDTGDREGKITEKKDWRLGVRSAGDVERVFASFRGEIRQVPPMYSAKKIKGKKLYELARKGKTVAREPRAVTIKEIKILDAAFPRVSFYVKCSKGTYIRQLAHDLGEKIGAGAYLAALRRTGVGPFKIRDAVSCDNLSYENILQPE
jgi:tRNA pseudouridine55 synthase